MKMKYYILINGMVKVSYYKMPNRLYNGSISVYSQWLNSLQPCEIDDYELNKIHNYIFGSSQVCDYIGTYEITDIVEEKDGKIYFKKPQQFGNTKQVNLNIEKIYKCECGWNGSWKQMKREQDFGYDQSCCPKCNNVMFNNLHGEIHCEQVNNNESDVVQLEKIYNIISQNEGCEEFNCGQRGECTNTIGTSYRCKAIEKQAKQIYEIFKNT